MCRDSKICHIQIHDFISEASYLTCCVPLNTGYFVLKEPILEFGQDNRITSIFSTLIKLTDWHFLHSNALQLSQFINIKSSIKNLISPVIKCQRYKNIKTSTVVPMSSVKNRLILSLLPLWGKACPIKPGQEKYPSLLSACFWELVSVKMGCLCVCWSVGGGLEGRHKNR